MMRLFFLFACLLALTAAQCPQPTPPGATFASPNERLPDWDGASANSQKIYPIDEQFDCGVRKVALEYASKVLQDVPDSKQAIVDVHAALALETCDSSAAEDGLKFWKPPNGNPVGQSAVEYYVSPQGNDDNKGTMASPFRTVTRARDEIRKTTVGQRESTSVILRKGVYYLNETFTLEPLDSGHSSEMPIKYTAYEGEPVTISGGIKVAVDWKKSQRDNIYSASVPGSFNISSLFRDGLRLRLARFPNGDSAIPQPSGYIPASGSGGSPTARGKMVTVNTKVVNRHNNQTISTGTQEPLDGNHTLYVDTPMYHKGSCAYFEAFEGGNLERFNTSLNRPLWNSKVDESFHYNPATWTKNHWSHADNARVHMFHTHFWGGWAFDVESVNESTHLVSFSKGGFQEARGGTIGKNLFYVENIMEELDDEGEFFFDSANHKLFLYTKKDPNNSSFEAPLLESLVTFRGSDKAPVQHITFDGITFRHSIPTFMGSYEPPPSGDWAIHRGGMVFFDGAENITISHCNFDQVPLLKYSTYIAW